jgi:hypothetical protein
MLTPESGGVMVIVLVPPNVVVNIVWLWGLAGQTRANGTTPDVWAWAGSAPN